ncbi:MAG: succinyl-diaminopimelate desuccinylase, partial [Rhodobacterales bacterium]|nr:succinyl-diaminopimelate desuccinylase [Rhodobacterales bacterium]
MDAAVKITSELIKKKTITPEDDGAIKFLTNILSASNFSCREIHSGNVKNLFARWGPKN